MIQSVLILHSDPDAARALGSYFSKRGDLVHQTSDEAQARTILENENPSLALIDLHLPGDTALAVIAHIRQDHSATRLIVTNKEPDVRLEMFAREQGAQVFLRAPFTPDWIERALERLEIGKQAQSQSTDHKRVVPRVRFPVQAKITLPYVLLAIAFVLASAFLASRYILESLQERFTNQLIDAGKLSTDWMVQEENRILETVRLLAHSEGMAQAVRERDADSLRKFALPVAINYEEETIEILDLQGTSLLSLHHRSGEDMTAYDASQGDRSFANLEPVQKVLHAQIDGSGDKYAGTVRIHGEETFYIASPLHDSSGELVGVVLVGKSADTLVRQIRQDTLAQLTIYGLEGSPLASTLFLSLMSLRSQPI